MKRTLISALLVSVAAAVAAPAFAQQSQGLTREQVREQLVAAQASGQLEQQRGRNEFPVDRAATAGTYAVATQHSVARYAKTSVPSNSQE
jgi:type II secretory pathway pseudopilin PulG